jgi:cytochrome P450/NADPH-cytochrome P450 reductase
MSEEKLSREKIKMAVKENTTLLDNAKVLATIPQPPAKFLLGNLLDVAGSTPTQDMIKLAREQGPIMQLDLPGRQAVIVSGFDLVDELSDESRFDKKVWSPLQKVRSFAGDGLFTAQTQEPNWHKAHTILLPNFSMKAMQGYFPMMLDIAQQLTEKWARLNANEEIDVPGDMTRLTLDTIGLCGFDYRFNSFYRENMHPFVESMVRALGESMESLQRLPMQEKLMVHKHRQMQSDIDFMNGMVDRIIQERKKSTDQAAKNDLLQHMLDGIDKQTGEGLDDTNIRYQIITFLIAGHETTSGLLSFALYYLLHNPEVLAKAYAEVDRVLGPDPSVAPTFAQVNRLKYVAQILKETLRLWPTAPLFSVYPYAGEAILGGKYRVTKDQNIAVLIPMLHRDKSVWGEDAEEFNPDHFTVEAEQERPGNAYKPFGNGQRACIGRQFAMQEATLVLGMVLQRFKLLDSSNYQLKIKETLTLKPDNFKISVRERSAEERTIVLKREATSVEMPVEAIKPVTMKQHHTPLLVLFGSNLGTAEDIAHRIAEDGNARGFAASVAALDDYTKRLPQEGALVIVSASYNGTPPDNAGKFCAWVKDPNLAADALKGVNYSVFGCGNREWASTFQAIPRLIDQKLEGHGAKRIYVRGEGDASDDFDGQFQAWYRTLWETLAQELSIDFGADATPKPQPMYEVEVINGTSPLNAFVASFGAVAMQVVANYELNAIASTQAAERSTRHVEVALPAGASYHAGDHLGVVARNSDAVVQRVAAHFGFAAQSKIRLHATNERRTHLPVEQPISVYALLADYVELQDVATRTQIKVMAEHTQCPPDKKKLLALSGDEEGSVARYRGEVMVQHKSLIDLLTEFPACELPFSVYLELLAPIRPRYYSISSSPLQESGRCSITVSVVKAAAKSGHGEFEGLCSTYLAGKEVGENIYAFVRDAQVPFRLPEDVSLPIIMVGPGTGIAPYRGFLQERAVLEQQGQHIGGSLLFFGCRHPQQDFIYKDELNVFVELGITNLLTAFSRLEQKKVYVQDKIWEYRESVWQLLEDGAVIYVCGDASKMAPDVLKTFAAIYHEKTGKSAGDAQQWLNELLDAKRYLVDVWSN